MLLRRNERSKFTSIFNPKNGCFVRVEDSDSEEPFWDSLGPELVDISITNYCEYSCGICYKKEKNKHNMGESEYNAVIDQLSAIGVFQVALGGGNPNLHPRFNQFLKYAYSHGIVPNYTTNGSHLTNEILLSTQQYCGVVGLSYYFQDNFNELMIEYQRYKIKTNIHIVVTPKNIESITAGYLQQDAFKSANAIIFLRYKPKKYSSGLSECNFSVGNLEKFFCAVDRARKYVKIGFDSCFVNLMINFLTVRKELVEPCEAARFSCYISEYLRMYPCSFMENFDEGVDLKEMSIMDCWQKSSIFVNVRDRLFLNDCTPCALFDLCRGGCPIFHSEFHCKNIA